MSNRVLLTNSGSVQMILQFILSYPGAEFLFTLLNATVSSEKLEESSRKWLSWCIKFVL